MRSEWKDLNILETHFVSTVIAKGLISLFLTHIH